MKIIRTNILSMDMPILSMNLPIYIFTWSEQSDGVPLCVCETKCSCSNNDNTCRVIVFDNYMSVVASDVFTAKLFIQHKGYTGEIIFEDDFDS